MPPCPHRSLLLAAPLLILACASTRKVRGPEGEEQAQKAEQLLEESEHQMKGFDVDTAQKTLERVRPLLKDPHLQTHPDLSVLWDRFTQDEGDLDIARKDKIKHELALKVNAQEQNVERARGPLLKAMDDLERMDVTSAQADATRAAQKKLQEALVPGKPLEAQDAGYAEEAKHAQRLLEKADASLALVAKRLAFIAGPLASADAGLKLMAQSKAEKDKTKRESLTTDAKAKLTECIDGTQKALQETAALGPTNVMIDGKPKPVSGVAAVCTSALKAADRTLALLAKASRKKPHK
jgi:hypothetical protein